jgi:hypothetical protein
VRNVAVGEQCDVMVAVRQVDGVTIGVEISSTRVYMVSVEEEEEEEEEDEDVITSSQSYQTIFVWTIQILLNWRMMQARQLDTWRRLPRDYGHS